MATFFANFDAKWLSERLNRVVSKVSFDEADLTKLNQSSSLRFATAEMADGEIIKLVIKVSEPNVPLAIMMGLAREAIFYQNWRDIKSVEGAKVELGSVLPRIYFAEGSMATGEKIVVMQDLSDSCIQLGHLFGRGNPNNWGKDLEALTSKIARPIGIPEATKLAYSAAAKLHAPYWGCSALSRDLPWLRCSKWLQGEGAEAWVNAQANTAGLWAQVKEKIAKGGEDYKVKWDPYLVACVDASINKVSAGGFEAFQAELKTRHITLVHGDFHPANFLLREKADDAEKQELLLMDWECCGLGSGPQELGQFMISHTNPSIRAVIEREAVATYYAELLELNSAITMTFEECWEEYVHGGLARWLFFLPYDGWVSVNL